MSLSPDADLTIPEETARVAHAAFPKGSIYMRMRDELGPIYADHDFAALFPRRGQPTESPARLALVTIMQFAEGLSSGRRRRAQQNRLEVCLGLGIDQPRL
jgi:transposase